MNRIRAAWRAAAAARATGPRAERRRDRRLRAAQAAHHLAETRGTMSFQTHGPGGH